MTNRKIILMFVYAGIGGAERMTVHIGKMLTNAGFDVKYVVIYLKKTDAPIKDFIPSLCEIEDVYCNNSFLLILKLFSLIKKYKPFSVFSSAYPFNYKLLLISLLLKKTKYVIRCDNYLFTYSFVQKLIIKKTYKYAEHIITQTKEMSDELIVEGISSKKKIVVLENPVDEIDIQEKIKDKETPYPQDGRKHIVAVGRFHYQKGFDLLVKACAELRKRRDDFDLYIVGYYLQECKPEYERVMQLVRLTGMENCIHCLGYKKNPYVYMAFADCFVLSSRWEGLPNVLAEALFLRRPVAAVKCIPMIERMVRDGIDGFLSEKDDIKGLVLAINNALNIKETSPTYRGACPNDFVSLFN